MGDRVGSVVLETLRRTKFSMVLRSGKFFHSAGIVAGERLIFSWQATGLLVFQTLYAIDLVWALVSGGHVTGGTEYMFDVQVPLFLRLMSLFHIVTPPLLLWAIWKLGYDKRGWKYQTLTAWIVSSHLLFLVWTIRHQLVTRTFRA